ncbi:MAG: hypothetical protein ABI435_07770 [Pseudolysinimonas sp.]
MNNETPGTGAAGDDAIAITIAGDFGTLTDPGQDPIRMEWTVGGWVRLIRLLPQPVTEFYVPVREVQSVAGDGAYVRITVAGTEYRLSFHAATPKNLLINPVGLATFDQGKSVVDSGWLQWADAFRGAGVPTSYSPGIAALGSPSIIRGVRIASFVLIGFVVLVVVAFIILRAAFGTAN